MVIQGVLSREDYAALWLAQQKGKHVLYIVLCVLIALFTFFLIGMSLLIWHFSVEIVSITFSCILVIVFMIVHQSLAYARHIVDKQLRSGLLRACNLGPVTVTVYGDRILLQTQQTRNEVHFSEIVNMTQTRRSFFLTCRSQSQVLLMPADAFPTLAARDACMAQLRACWNTACTAVGAAAELSVCAEPANVVATLSYALTQDEFLEGMMAATRVVNRREKIVLKRLLLLAWGAVLLFYGIACLPRSLSLVVVCCGVGLFCMLISLLTLIPGFIRRTYQRNLHHSAIYAQMLHPVTLYVCPDRLAGKHTLFYSEYLTAEVTGIVWTDTTLCVLIGARLVMLIPRRVLTDEAVLQRLLECLHATQSPPPTQL